MELKLEMIQDKVECFEARDFKALEKAMNEQIEHNQALLLEVANIHHYVHLDPKTSQPVYTATVHFRAKK